MTDAEMAFHGSNLIISDSLEAAYDLTELISERPGMWTLLAQRKSDGKKCVAKLFSGAMRKSGKREADILRKLDHPDIPKLVEYMEDGDTCVVIREYAEGKPLDRYVAERVISEPVIIGIGMKICCVLEYLHGLPEPVIHRDIKPQNIIVDDSGEIKLIDFGISRIRNEQSAVDTVFAGTVAYAPPEQYGFRQTDQRADIYSLGMVLQYMLTGNVDTTSDKCGTEGSCLGEIIGKCTSFAPEKRFRNIKELHKSLARLNRRPAPRALIAGLLAAFLHEARYALLLGLFGLLAALRLKNRERLCLILGAVLGAVCWFRYDLAVKQPLCALDGQTVLCTGTVTDAEPLQSGRMIYMLRTELAGRRVSIDWYADADVRPLQIGDSVTLEAALTRIQPDYRYHTVTYEAGFGKYLRIYRGTLTEAAPKQGFSLRRVLHDYRARMTARIRAMLP